MPKPNECGPLKGSPIVKRLPAKKIVNHYLMWLLEPSNQPLPKAYEDEDHSEPATKKQK